MDQEKYGLGGRLPLQEPSKLESKQRVLYDQICATAVPWGDAAGFKSKDDEGRLIGPFNATLFSPAIAGAFLAMQSTEQAQTSLTARTREVIILSVGSVWKTPYELYAHAAVAIKCGISSEAVAALIAGVEAVDVAEDEKIAQRFTRQLVIEHAVDDQTYARARERFGDRALVEMVTLIGCYLTVCALLNAFAVPVPEGVPRFF